MTRQQHTIARETTFSGVGLHSGEKATLRLKPALPNAGVQFVRSDLPGSPRIPASLGSVGERLRQTCLVRESAEVQTVEHLLAALQGAQVDNLVVEMDGPEVPGSDGSAKEFHALVRGAGLVDQGIESRFFKIEEPVSVSDGDVSIVALPYRESGLRITYTLSYPGSDTFFGSQHLSVDVAAEFAQGIAPARTYCLESEVDRLRKQGFGKGATHANTLVVGKEGVIGNTLRFPDEFVRHKILDLVGDLAILGVDLQGHIIAIKSGHRANIRFVRRLHEQIQTSRGEFSRERGNPEVFDIQKILEMIPHRYPFLLVDRILEFIPNKRVVGVKNVTFNEPFFQGHYPGHPIMPGVLQVEAMAQTAGVLLLAGVERGYERIPFLMTLDKVKLRKTVIPGDRLILEAEPTRMRNQLAQVNTRALVEGVVVAEAQMKFILTEGA